MRLIDADALKENSYRDEFAISVVTVEDIDNAPTVEFSKEICSACGRYIRQKDDKSKYRNDPNSSGCEDK